MTPRKALDNMERRAAFVDASPLMAALRAGTKPTKPQISAALDALTRALRDVPELIAEVRRLQGRETSQREYVRTLRAAALAAESVLMSADCVAAAGELRDALGVDYEGEAVEGG